MARRDTIQRVFEIQRMFETGQRITAIDICERLNLSRPAAMYWINQISRFMPIVEDGVKPSKGGRPRVAFRLMK